MEGCEEREQPYTLVTAKKGKRGKTSHSFMSRGRSILKKKSILAPASCKSHYLLSCSGRLR